MCVYLLSPHNQYPSLLVSVVYHTSPNCLGTPNSPLTCTTFPSLVPILPVPNLHSHSCFHTLPQIPVPLSNVPVFSLVSISCHHPLFLVPFPCAHLLSSLTVSPSTLAAFTPSQTPRSYLSFLQFPYPVPRACPMSLFPVPFLSSSPIPISVHCSYFLFLSPTHTSFSYHFTFPPVFWR